MSKPIEPIESARRDRQRICESSRSIMDGAEGRELSAAEQARIHDHNRQLDVIDTALGNGESDFDRRKREESERVKASGDAFRELMAKPIDARAAEQVDEATVQAWRRGQRGGDSRDGDLSGDVRRWILANSHEPLAVSNPSPRSGYRPAIEHRDLLTTSGSGMLPTSFYDRLVRHLVDNAAVMSAGATLINTDSGEPLKIPKTTAHSSAGIVNEGAAIAESDPGLGSVTLGAFKYGYRFDVSYELVTDSNFDLLAYVAEQAGANVGNAFGAHLVSGTGTGEPQGILGDVSAGVTGATGVSGQPSGDDLIDLQHSLVPGYSRSASAAWIMNNSTLAFVRKLKASGTGEYLFDLGTGTLLGRPVFVDPNVPNIATGAESILYGDWSRVYIRQANQLRFERSNDVRFDNDMIAFRVLARLDGALIDTTGAIKSFQGGAA